MSLNNQNSQLKDLIILEEKIIPKGLCDYIVSTIQNEKWETHKWHNYSKDIQFSNQTNEPSVFMGSNIHLDLLSPYIIEAKNRYTSKVSYNESASNITNTFSHIRFNKYEVGQTMRDHHDHIRTLFTPPDRGIPILSMIIGLNDDYDGGELVFWDSIEFKIKTGDIIIWPSLFLYPHRVNKITKNIRYTAVSWLW